MADRLALIDADQSLLSDDFTGDPDSLTEGQRLVVAPIDYDPFIWKWDQDVATSDVEMHSGWVTKFVRHTIDYHLTASDTPAALTALIQHLRNKGVIASDDDQASILNGEVP